MKPLGRDVCLLLLNALPRAQVLPAGFQGDAGKTDSVMISGIPGRRLRPPSSVHGSSRPSSRLLRQFIIPLRPFLLRRRPTHSTDLFKVPPWMFAISVFIKRDVAFHLRIATYKYTTVPRNRTRCENNKTRIEFIFLLQLKAEWENNRTYHQRPEMLI